MLHQCRQRIDAQAAGDLHENLLVVAQVLMRLRYNDPQFFAIFGGSRVMIESPLIEVIVDQAKCEGSRTSIVAMLEERFGVLPPEISARLQARNDEALLRSLA